MENTRTNVLLDGTRVIYNNRSDEKVQKREIIVILPNGAKGIAKCSPADEYDENLGFSMALGRAKKKSKKIEARKVININDRIRCTQDTEYMRTKGELGTITGIVEGMYFVRLDRKVMFQYVGRDKSVVVKFTNLIKIPADKVEKVLRRNK